MKPLTKIRSCDRILQNDWFLKGERMHILVALIIIVIIGGIGVLICNGFYIKHK